MLESTLQPIKAETSNAKLQTYEIHSYLPPYSEVTYSWGSQNVKRIIDSKSLPSYAWSTRFYIGDDGLINSPNYFDGSFSTMFALHWKEHSTEVIGKDHDTHRIITTTPGRYSPDLLYAIPQVTWNDFIAQLPLQNIVIGLNLSVHRHLWPAYNYSASTEDFMLRNWRANAFNRYHFLVALLDPVNNENNFYGGNYIWKEIIDNGLVGKREMIDQAVKLYGSYVTPIYLDKFSHCPSFYHFTGIGDGFILPKSQSIYGDEIVNVDKLNEFIAALPSSKNDPLQFENMISDVDAINKINIVKNDMKIKSRVFYHTRNNFGLFKNKNFDNYAFCSDYFTAIFDDLIYPEILRAFAKPSSNASLNLYYIALNRFTYVLHEYLPIDKLMSLAERWHKKRFFINARKPESTFLLEWHPLFNTQIINQVTFTCIVNEAGLKIEGEEMHHCVGGFSKLCLLGEIHIIKVQTVSGERSTLTLEAKKDTFKIKDKFEIIENLTIFQKTPCDEIINASQVFLDKIRNDEIKVNPQRGQTKRSSEKLDDISTYYPYSLNDEDIQESVYQAYKPEQVLPFLMSGRDFNYKKMIAKLSEKFSIVDCIRDAIPDFDQKVSNRL
jgi:hypothetical protein